MQYLFFFQNRWKSKENLSNLQTAQHFFFKIKRISEKLKQSSIALFQIGPKLFCQIQWKPMENLRNFLEHCFQQIPLNLKIHVPNKSALSTHCFFHMLANEAVKKANNEENKQKKS